jgi:hypothetical protein
VNPHVELDVVDPIVRRGWRFRGTGTVYREGPQLEQGLAIAEALFSPAYDSGLTEQDLAPRWLGHFTELHAGLLP